MATIEVTHGYILKKVTHKENKDNSFIKDFVLEASWLMVTLWPGVMVSLAFWMGCKTKLFEKMLGGGKGC